MVPRLELLEDTQRRLNSPRPNSPRMELTVPNRLRVPSGQSFESRFSDSDIDFRELREPPSPIGIIFEDGQYLEPVMTSDLVKVDINCQRAADDMSAVNDGPLFRATMKALEQKTGNMRLRMKKVLKKAEAAKDTQVACNYSIAAFMEALREASSSNANAVQPALDHYFERIAKEILTYEKQNAENLQKLIIDPISKLYSNDIKQAEAKRKDFEDESRDYYAYASRYLGQRQDSLKEKKQRESDSKYQSKRLTFELKRFDYSSFMQDLHGGRKDQEVLSQLTKYADAQAQGYLTTAKKIEAMIPQLEALSFEVREANKEYELQRTGREEKRRALVKGTNAYGEPDAASAPLGTPATPRTANGRVNGSTDPDPGSSNGMTLSKAERLQSSLPANAGISAVSNLAFSIPPVDQPTTPSPAVQDKFKGIRDLEDKDYSAASNLELGEAQFRKEGLLWALSKPGSHADPKGLNKQAWHKYDCFPYTMI